MKPTKANNLAMAAAAFAGVMMISTGSVAAQAVLKHSYSLDNSFADTLGGSVMAGAGGTLGTTGYTFAADQGPNVSNAFDDPADYTIEMRFKIDDTAGWRKLIDSIALLNEFGLYNVNGKLNLWNYAGESAVVFSDNTFHHMIVTRNGTTDEFEVFVDSTSAALSLIDTSDYVTFTATDGIAHFLRDDAGGTDDDPSGFLDYVAIWDGVMDSAQIADRITNGATAPVPEPATSFLLLCGGLAHLLRRRTGA